MPVSSFYFYQTVWGIIFGTSVLSWTLLGGSDKVKDGLHVKYHKDNAFGPGIEVHLVSVPWRRKVIKQRERRTYY